MALNIIRQTRVLIRQSLIGVISRSQQQQQQQLVHTTSSHYGLEEFFDSSRNLGERQVKSGRAWRTDELRLKSNSDLHKLWFVLYKERNMLYTMKEAAATEYELFPSPERIDKVEESMANLENVVRERNNAYWQLEVSPCATGERPSIFRRDVFGRHRWHKCSQHIPPYHRNWHFRNTQGPGKTNETDWFFHKYREMKRKHYNYFRSRTARYLRDLFRRFPNADAEYIAELHPEFPQGYVQHLKENHVLYDDPPRAATRARIRPSEDVQQ
uniref:Large ribosomal subunit protein uL29m n=1 Tax=Aceria tosichella TaxID=561515 RepID=A0A6G1SMS9_9ACAR